MAQAPDQVNRLVDMQVQEVSLVDRAANKRRFLVVKRSDGMGDTSTTAGAADGTVQGDQGESEAGTETGAATGDSESSAVGIAADALEGLTRAVEQLQGAGADVGSVLADVVQELRAAADLLQEHVGGEPDNAPDDGGSGAPANARLDSLLSAMGDLVTELRASRTSAKAADAETQEDEEETAGKGKPGKASKAAAGTDATPASSDLKAVHAELKNITGLLQQHTRRLDRLEKRAGAPSSQPAGERPTRPQPSAADDVSWPLDLNSPQRR